MLRYVPTGHGLQTLSVVAVGGVPSSLPALQVRAVTHGCDPAALAAANSILGTHARQTRSLDGVGGELCPSPLLHFVTGVQTVAAVLLENPEIPSHARGNRNVARA